ncbi:hypothetical protein PCANC_08206 [Puccinia coronata f. sp. avenae]|uniref:Uncharacterized protein n=1 Tax=Puccinia coronata f. sp. avenae TaxID=200324 RepID=A0A2N5VJH6_9BASI|nr:hypothetical protein PCANC_08206 [Puccinia coronata f. sp. avenae]
MANISELPQEILDLIFQYIIAASRPTRGRPWVHHHGVVLYRAGPLRLVCRTWADWLYQHHLYHSLSFSSTSQSLAFIDHLQTRSRTFPRPHCENLRVANIWTCDQDVPQFRPQLDKINSEILESFIEVFSSSITTLHLHFMHFFTPPTQTIKAIGRVKNLNDLKRNLYLITRSASEVTAEESACFNSLMMEAQGLKTLQLSFPVPLPYNPDQITGTQYPSITHLEVDTFYEFDSNATVGVLKALKRSLKLLSIRDPDPFIDDDEDEDERGGQALLSLRVVVIQGFERSFSILRWLGKFSQAPPIGIIAIRSEAEVDLAEIMLDAFSMLPRLRKLVFIDTTPEYSPSPIHLAACEAHHVECIYLWHDDLGEIMKLLL